MRFTTGRPRRRPTALVLLSVLVLAAIAPAATSATDPWATEAVVRTGSGERLTSGDALARTSPGSVTYLHSVAMHDGGQDISDGGIHFARSGDDGQSWGKVKRLNGVTQRGVDPAITATGQHVYVTWRRMSPGSSRSMIYVRVNTDHGLLSAWRDRIRLTSTTGRVGAPSVAVSGASVYVVYTDGVTRTIHVQISRDRGASWRRISLATTTRSDGQPVVVAAGPNIGVFWVTSSDGYIKGRVSTDSGAHWAAKQAIEPGEAPSARALGSRIAVAAMDLTGDRMGPWVRVWTAGSWGPRRAVPHTPPLLGFPVVALRGATQIGIAMTNEADPTIPDEVESSMVWLESPDGGVTWAPTEIVSTSGPYNTTPSVVWRSTGGLYVLWNVRFYDDGGRVAIRTRLPMP